MVQLNKGLFENNVFIEEIIEEDENLETSGVDTENDAKNNNSLKNKKKRKIKKKDLKLPKINGNNEYQSYSAKKPLLKNSSDPTINKNSKSNNRKQNIKNKNSKNRYSSVSLPRINPNSEFGQMSERLNGFSGVIKSQAFERNQLEKYFKSLDKAVNILNKKREEEFESRHWIPTGPIHSFHYSPTTKAKFWV